MIQKGTPTYYARLFIKVEEGGFHHLHQRGVEPMAPEGLHLGAEPRYPFVNDGRWLVSCPNPRCGSTQLASPDMDRFWCPDCCNVAHDHQWIPVAWYPAKAVHAIESALLVRPDIYTRNWYPDESVGALLVENVEAGLIDPSGEGALGDVGYPQTKLLGGRVQIARQTPAIGTGDG